MREAPTMVGDNDKGGEVVVRGARASGKEMNGKMIFLMQKQLI